MSSEIPSEIKVECPCGKQISKKNMAVHLKTAAHTKICAPENTVSELPKEVSPKNIESSKEPSIKNNSGELKIKLRFDQLDTKLDNIMDVLEELADELLGLDENLPQ